MARKRTQPTNPIAAAVIDALGGDTQAARVLQTPISTVASWKVKGIPAWRRDKILDAAKRLRASNRLKRDLPREFVEVA